MNLYGFSTLAKGALIDRAKSINETSDFFNTHLQQTEKTVIEEQKRVDKWYEEKKKEYGDSEGLADYAYELWLYAHEVNPSLVYGAILLSIYAYYEGYLFAAYKDIQKYGSYNPINKNIDRIYSHDVLQFLKDNNLYDETKYTSYIEYFKDMSVIRNKFAHSFGEPIGLTKSKNDTEPPITSILEKYPSIKFNDDKFWFSDTILLAEFNQKVRQFLHTVFLEVESNVE